ncbi:MAG: branched-chain amino acid ABC transporter permease [Acidimicrobiales bacterium]
MTRLAMLAVAVAAIAAWGTTMSPSSLDLGVLLLTYITIAQAMNMLAGYAGQISIGSALFVGAGGYTVALSTIHLSMPWPLALAAAAVVSGALAAMLSVALLRLRGDYFAIGTLAAALAGLAFVENWMWAGGSSGLFLPAGSYPTGRTQFFLALLVATVSTAVVVFVANSSFGLRLTAIRDNEAAALGLGVSTTRHRFIAFVASSALIGMAGAIVAFRSVAIAPAGQFGLTWSLNGLLMPIVGGMATIVGPIIGVLVVYLGLIRLFEDAQTWSLAIQGVLLIVIVRFAPRGIWPLCVTLARRLVSPRPAPPAGQTVGEPDPSAPDRTASTAAGDNPAEGADPVAAASPRRSPRSKA